MHSKICNKLNIFNLLRKTKTLAKEIMSQTHRCAQLNSSANFNWRRYTMRPWHNHAFKEHPDNP